MNQTPSAPSVGPTLGSDRIVGLDAARGVAILGVLLAYTVWNLGAPPQESWSAADHIVGNFMDLLVDGKFLTMFAFLFGVGVAQQWRRWERDGAPNVTALHARRMGFLLAVGLLHAVLLRNGDILAPYALLGLLLLAFRRASVKTLAISATLFFVASFVARGVVFGAGLPWPERPTEVAGTYLTENLAWLRYWYATNPVVAWPQIFTLMLLGVITGRARAIERIAASPALARRILLAALPVLPLAILTVAGTRAVWKGPSLTRDLIGNSIYNVGVMALAAAYGTTVLLLAQRESLKRYLAPLRDLGRMAFTNYLVQAFLIVPFCLAFDLFDKVTPTRGVWLALAVAVIQLRFTTWWSRRYQVGPFEQLWRAATYGRSARLRAPASIGNLQPERE